VILAVCDLDRYLFAIVYLISVELAARVINCCQLVFATFLAKSNLRRCKLAKSDFREGFFDFFNDLTFDDANFLCRFYRNLKQFCELKKAMIGHRHRCDIV
jgi:hypothetical protein